MSGPGRPTAGTEAAYERLRAVLGRYDSMVVAFSGGVDSCLLAYAAREVLGDRMLAVIAVTPSLPRYEEDEAVAFLRLHGIPFERIVTNEIDDDAYRANNPDRCYHCKSELFGKLETLARSRGFACVAYGANLDDGSDFRPGMSAAEEKHIAAPLAGAGLDKGSVREISRSLGLSSWDKPASPCLASRIPYYEEVTREKLSRVEKAESVLRAQGFKVCRVRCHGDVGRIEVPLADQARLLEEGVRRAVVDGVREAGFRFVAVDLEGFRSGRLNEALAEE